MSRKRECLTRLAMAGRISLEKAREIDALVDQLELAFREQSGPEQAARRAEQEAARIVLVEAKRKKKLELMTLQVRVRIARDLQRAAQEYGEKGMRLAAEAQFDSVGLEHLGIRGVEQERKALLAMAHGKLADLLARFHTNVAGQTRNKADLMDLVREAFGEDSGNQAAKELQKAWREVAEELRQKFNEAGGDIGKLEGWGLPQAHDATRIYAMGKDAWIDYVLPRLDRQRMISRHTGMPMTDEELRIVLDGVWNDIVTDGWASKQPVGQRQGTAMANRRQEHRFLFFKDAKSWIEYQEQFGNPDPWAAMMHYVDEMTRDIAALRRLGPNPHSTVEWLKQLLEKEGQQFKVRQWPTPGLPDSKEQQKSLLRKATNLLDGVARTQHTVQTMWDIYNGTAHVPASKKLARAAATTRSMLVAAQLGSAMLSALSDMGFGAITSRFVGLRYDKVIGKQLKLLLQPAQAGGREARTMAIRAGLVAEEWGRVARNDFRFTAEAHSNEVATRLANGVLRLSGLSPWTQAGRHAFQLEFMGMLADHAGKSFDDLPAALRRTLRRYRIGKGEWDVIRSTRLYEPQEGATFLRPDDVRMRTDIDAGQAEELAFRMLHMIQSEVEYAVPTTSLRTQAFLYGGKAGTVGGEILRSASMYRSFAVTLLFTHFRRIKYMDNGWNAARYAAAMFATLTVMGAFSYQLKQIARGRDPQPMNTPGFWMRAMLQGGGLGIFGDFLLDPGQNRFGHSMGETVAGPVFGLLGDVARLTTGKAVGWAAEGDIGKPAAELVRFVGRYAPGASLWYLRLALERHVLDQLLLMADEDAPKRWRRQMKKLKRETGQEFFAPPGQPLFGGEDVRMPDLGAAFGQ